MMNSILMKKFLLRGLLYTHNLRSTFCGTEVDQNPKIIKRFISLKYNLGFASD